MKDNITIAKKLYNPTPKVEKIVIELCKLFDTPLPNGITISSLSFQKGKLKLCKELDVKEIVRSNDHLFVEIHWYPMPSISTTSDPFCSAFVLRYNSLLKLYKEIKKVFSSLHTQKAAWD